MVRSLKASTIAVLVAVVATVGIWSVAGAQSQAYKFEAVPDEISVGEGVRIEVRLLDPDGKPVPSENVDIVSTRLDMGPEGMAMMDTPLTPLPAGSADVLAFETKIAMAGRWALAIEVRVDGVPEPVKGVVIFTAVEKKAD
ncbi:MAG: FixH family protein, partial [Parvibaculum sp.]